MLEINKIYNVDCLEGMKLIPDKYFDLVLTDPPYGIGESGKTNHSRSVLAKAKKFNDYDWDNKIPDKAVFDEIFRVSKNQIIFGGNYFVEYLHNSSCWIVWDKNNGENDFADCELAWTSFKSAVRKFKYTWQGMLQENMKNKEQRYHPTQKPLSLMAWIINNYTNEGDLICDPFMGSGTTGLACLKTNRKFIGFEIIKEYAEIANKRIEDEKTQFSFFSNYNLMNESR